jgi:hypothetical protein
MPLKKPIRTTKKGQQGPIPTANYMETTAT